MSATRPGSEAVNRIPAAPPAPAATRNHPPPPSLPTTAWTITSKMYSSVLPTASVTWRVTVCAPALENVYVTTGPSRIATTDPVSSRIVQAHRTTAPPDPPPAQVT